MYKAWLSTKEAAKFELHNGEVTIKHMWTFNWLVQMWQKSEGIEE